MSDDELIQKEILEILAQQYDKDPHKTISKRTIISKLNLEDAELEGYALRLEYKQWIELEHDTSDWEAKITPFGYEQYIELLKKADINIQQIPNKKMKSPEINDAELRILILEYLRENYGNTFSDITSQELANVIGVDEWRINNAIRFLDEDGMIRDFGSGYTITTKGIRYLERRELKNTKSTGIKRKDDLESLELEVTSDNFRGIMDVFISHKFVKEDQTLAGILRKHLREKGIEGYLAETRREYDLLISEKIKNKIEASDYLVGIITKNSLLSHSVNQEIGYALGRKIPVILMLEQGASHGVLTHGREIEEFTRSNFDYHCKNIVNFIIEKGARKKISDEEKKSLVENVYRPCFNQMMNEYKKREFIDYIPANKWRELEPFWQLKTEPEMKELFEEYTTELEKWHKLWIGFANNAQSHQHELGEIIKSAFDKVGLLKGNSISLGQNSSIDPKDWVRVFSIVISDSDIHGKEELYIKLFDYSIKTRNGHHKWLEEWKEQKPDLFFYILELIPRLAEKLNSSISKQHLDTQRETLKTTIEKLTLALEEKLK